jgi:predicted ATP-dependent serine protease
MNLTRSLNESKTLDRPFKWVSFAELPRRTPADDIVEGLFGPGEVMILAGSHSAGKSTLVFDLAASLVGGRDEFLGQRVQHPGAVFIAAGEGYGCLRTRMLAAGLEESRSNNIAFRDEVPYLADPNGVDEFIQELKERLSGMEGPPALVVIDTLCLALNGAAENSNPLMGLVAKNARAIARELHCAVLLVHHSPKGNDQEVRGAGSLSAAADVVLSLRIQEAKTRILTTEKQRDRDGNGQWNFDLEVVEVEGATAQRVTNPKRVTESDLVPETDPDKDAIVAFLERAGGPVQSGPIRDATGIQGKRLLRLLRELEKSGEIQVTRSENTKDRRNTRYAAPTDGGFDVEESGEAAA